MGIHFCAQSETEKEINPHLQHSWQLLNQNINVHLQQCQNNNPSLSLKLLPIYRRAERYGCSRSPKCREVAAHFQRTANFNPGHAASNSLITLRVQRQLAKMIVTKRTIIVIVNVYISMV